jgi:hypothetical protein
MARADYVVGIEIMIEDGDAAFARGFGGSGFWCRRF